MQKEKEFLTWNIVTMHDLGKLNPAFQKEKMKHIWKPELRPDSEIGSKHSMLSAVFYLEYYIKEIKSKAEVIGKPEVKLLREYAYIYSYIISRHHGNLVEFQRYVESFHDEEDFENIAKKWMKRWKEEIEHEKFTNYKLEKTKRTDGIKQKCDISLHMDKIALFPSGCR